MGCNAQQVRQGIRQRGAATRQGERTPGPIRPETLANHSVKRHVRELACVFKGALRALAAAGVFGTQVTGMAAGADLETTAPYRDCGQATRQGRREDTPGQRHAMAGTGDGWEVRLLSAAVTPIPLAGKGGPRQEHEPHRPRALVTQARPTLAGAARRPTVVVETGCWEGTALWWLDRQGLRWVVPAKAHPAATAEARAQAAAGDGIPVGRRVHTVRQGQGKAASTERVETAVVGIPALTTDDP